MKNIKLLLFSIIGILTVTSCSINKQIHIHGYKNSTMDNRQHSKNYTSDKQNKKSNNEYIASSSNNSAKEKNLVATVSSFTDDDYSVIQNTSMQNRFLQSLAIDEGECDNIILRNGDEIEAKVIEVSEEYIQYKKCDNLDGPIYNVSKSSVFMIKYANGTKDVFKEEKKEETNNKLDQNKNNESEQNNTAEQKENKVEPTSPKSENEVVRKLDIVSLISFILGNIAFMSFLLAISIGFSYLLIGTFIFFVAAFILGIIGMHRTSKYRDKYKGKGFAIAGFIIGVVGMSLSILIFAIITTVFL